MTENTGKVTLREFIEQRLDKMDNALKLQALEYERRLDVLNHAHAEAKDVIRTYATREMLDTFIIEHSCTTSRIITEKNTNYYGMNFPK